MMVHFRRNILLKGGLIGGVHPGNLFEFRVFKKGFSPNLTDLNLNYDAMPYVHSILLVRLTPRYMSTVNKTAVQEALDRPVDIQFCLYIKATYFIIRPQLFFHHLTLEKWSESPSFLYFGLDMWLAPQGRPFFRHVIFQKWSNPIMFSTF